MKREDHKLTIEIQADFGFNFIHPVQRGEIIKQSMSVKEEKAYYKALALIASISK
jgi:hypothetical protein